MCRRSHFCSASSILAHHTSLPIIYTSYLPLLTTNLVVCDLRYASAPHLCPTVSHPLPIVFRTFHIITISLHCSFANISIIDLQAVPPPSCHITHPPLTAHHLPQILTLTFSIGLHSLCSALFNLLMSPVDSTIASTILSSYLLHIMHPTAHSDFVPPNPIPKTIHTPLRDPVSGFCKLKKIMSFWWNYIAIFIQLVQEIPAKEWGTRNTTGCSTMASGNHEN